jgi:hypothetical protein
VCIPPTLEGWVYSQRYMGLYMGYTHAVWATLTYIYTYTLTASLCSQLERLEIVNRSLNNKSCYIIRLRCCANFLGGMDLLSSEM